MLRTAFALSLACSLAACSNGSLDEQGSFANYSGIASPGYGGQSYGARGFGNGVDPRSLANPVMPRAYAALPGGAGPVVNVLEQRFANGLTQEIILAGDVPTGGENNITVSMLSRQASSFDATNPGMLRLRKSSDTEIFQEVSDQFPDINMSLSQIVDRNAQGPFGYALGHRGRITCIYAWQWIEDHSGRDAVFFDLSASDGPSATLRVRLCKTGMSDQTLAGFVRQLVLTPGGGLGGAYAGGGTPYNPYQAAGFGGGADALTVAGHAGPVALPSYQQRAALHGNGQPLALYNTPAQYQGVSAQPDPSYQVRRVRYRHVARHQPRVRYRNIYRAPAEPLYDGQTAAAPLPGPVSYVPAPTAQAPRYVPLGRATGAPGGVYGAVPLPE